MNRLAILGICVSLVGCSTVAETYDFDNSRTFQTDYDTAWEAVITYFAEENIAIKTIAKDSGIIVAEQGAAEPPEMAIFASCAKPVLMQPTSGSYLYNIFVKADGAAKTRVQVNTKFWQVYFGAYNTIKKVECNSNGKMEGLLLTRIGNMLKK